MDPGNVGPLLLPIALLVVAVSATAVYRNRSRSGRPADAGAPPQGMVIHAGDLSGLAKSGALVVDGREGRYSGGLDEMVSGTRFFGYQVEWVSDRAAPVRLDLLFRGPSAEGDRLAILAVEVDGEMLVPDARSTRDIRNVLVRAEVESALLGIRSAAANARMELERLVAQPQAEHAERIRARSDQV